MTNRRPHETVRLTADLVILTVREGRLQLLLVERKNQPYQGQPALPGGFLRPGECLEDTALRELAEETALDGAPLHLEQLRTYSAPDRDPRGRVVTTAYLALAPDLPVPVAGSDARSARWETVEWALSPAAELAFDHHDIVRDGVELARAKLEYTTLAAVFCGATFTIADLRHVYEVVWGRSLDPGNFNRKVTNSAGFLSPTGAKRSLETGRPAALYRRGAARTLSPPMLRANA